MKKKDKWPKTLLCIQQDDGQGPYILPYEDAKDVAIPDQEVPVAVYQFVGMFSVKAPVELAGAVVCEVEHTARGFRRPKKK